MNSGRAPARCSAETVVHSQAENFFREPILLQSSAQDARQARARSDAMINRVYASKRAPPPPPPTRSPRSAGPDRPDRDGTHLAAEATAAHSYRPALPYEYFARAPVTALEAKLRAALKVSRNHENEMARHAHELSIRLELARGQVAALTRENEELRTKLSLEEQPSGV